MKLSLRYDDYDHRMDFNKFRKTLVLEEKIVYNTYEKFLLDNPKRLNIYFIRHE